jgi:hypothetical protein
MTRNSMIGQAGSHPAEAAGTSGRKPMPPDPRGKDAAKTVREKHACPALPEMNKTANPAGNMLLYTNKTANLAGNMLLYMNKTANPAGNMLLYMNKTVNPAGNMLLYMNKTANPAGFIKTKSPALARKMKLYYKQFKLIQHESKISFSKSAKALQSQSGWPVQRNHRGGQHRGSFPGNSRDIGAKRA